MNNAAQWPKSDLGFQRSLVFYKVRFKSFVFTKRHNKFLTPSSFPQSQVDYLFYTVPTTSESRLMNECDLGRFWFVWCPLSVEKSWCIIGLCNCFFFVFFPSTLKSKKYLSALVPKFYTYTVCSSVLNDLMLLLFLSSPTAQMIRLHWTLQWSQLLCFFCFFLYVLFICYCLYSDVFQSCSGQNIISPSWIGDVFSVE